MYVFLFFFFFNQKTAYEMRISDWSSDVCSSDLVALDAHLVGVVLAAEGCRLQAGADFHRLHRVDRHHRLGEVGVELVVDRLAEPRRHARGHHLDHRAGRGARLAHAVEIAFPGRGRLRIGAPEGIPLDGVPVPVATLDAVRAHLHEGAADAYRHWGDVVE